jgi:hypothetical protein
MYCRVAWRNQWMNSDIDGVRWSQSMGCLIMKILRNFDVCRSLTFFALINSQSLNDHMMHRRLGYFFPMNITPSPFVCTCQPSFSNLSHTAQWVTEHPTIMPRMVSFLKDIKRYHTVLGDMLLYPLTLFTSSHTSVIFRHLDFCAVQILCTVCSTYIAIDRWDAHRSAHGRESASQPTTSTFNISIDTTSFDSFFHHENVQGERLSLIQRSTIVALHSLNIRNDVIAHLTHCDPHTIQHWITRYEDGDSLEDEPRSGRPRVTSEVTDTSIVAAAT